MYIPSRSVQSFFPAAYPLLELRRFAGAPALFGADVSRTKFALVLAPPHPARLGRGPAKKGLA